MGQTLLTALIVEDNPRDRQTLELLLQRYCAASISVIGSAATVTEAAAMIRQHQPGLIFLDVELGGASGFELLSLFPDPAFAVIFVSGHSEYALRAIKFSAVDYVLKPVDPEELAAAVNKAVHAGSEYRNRQLEILWEHLAQPKQPAERIAIPLLNGFYMTTVNDILYCEASREYTLLHQSGQPAICSSRNLGEYENLLEAAGFFRVHHSYLVNRRHIRQYIRGEGGELIMTNDTIIPVSRRRKTGMLHWLTGKNNV